MPSKNLNMFGLIKSNSISCLISICVDGSFAAFHQLNLNIDKDLQKSMVPM